MNDDDKTIALTFGEARNQKKLADARRSNAVHLEISAARWLERSVIAALSGERLCGLPNLGTGTDAFHGINVRAKNPAKRLYYGEPALVIDRFGQLTVVEFGKEEVVSGRAEISDLRAGDLRRVVDGYRLAAKKHAERCDAVSKEAQGLYELVRCIDDALAKHAAGQGS